MLKYNRFMILFESIKNERMKTQLLRIQNIKTNSFTKAIRVIAMGDITSISLEETNKIRASLGLKLIPILSDNVQARHDTRVHSVKIKKVRSIPQESTADISHPLEDDHELQTLRNRIQESKKQLDSANGKKEIEDNESIDDWLANVGKASTTNDKPSHRAVKANNSAGVSEGAANITIPSELRVLVNEKPLILTLKETTEHDIDDEDGYQDILENEDQAHDKQDAENLKLRKLNENRKLGKVSLYDYEREGNENDALRETEQIVEPQLGQNRIRIRSSSSDEDDTIQDYAPIKLKKRKKKSAKQTKPRKIDNNKMMKVDLINFDDDVDEEPLQAMLKVKRKIQKVNANETNSEQERRDASIKRMGIHILNKSNEGFVFDDTDEFLGSLKGDILEKVTENKPIKIDLKNPQRTENVIIPESSTSEEKEENKTALDFSGGVARMLSFLKKKNYLNAQNGGSQHFGGNVIKSGAVNLEEAKVLRSINSASENLASRLNSQEMNLSEEELGKIRSSNEEDIASKLHKIQAEKLHNYNPNVELSYRDSEGNELTTKEAYKKLSQSWHGTKSNKKTMDKQRKKIAQRKKIMERESLFEE